MRTNPTKTTEVVKIIQQIETHKIELEISPWDFERTLGRLPSDDSEFEAFCRLCRLGLMNEHIDWKKVFDTAISSHN